MGPAAPHPAVLWPGSGAGHWSADGAGRVPSGRPLAWKWSGSLVRRWGRPRPVRPSSGLEMERVTGPPMGPAAPHPAVLWPGSGAGHWSADGAGRAPSGRPLAWTRSGSLVRRWGQPRPVRLSSGLDMERVTGPPMGPAAPRPAVLWPGNGAGHWSADGAGRAPSGRPLAGLEMQRVTGPPMG